MKRIKKISIFLFFILLFMPIFLVQAEEKATCADVQDAVSKLEDLDSMYSGLNCDSTSNNKDKYECNSIQVQRNVVLEKIFEYNDQNICSSVDLSSIIENNGENCSNKFSSQIKTVTDTVMNFFYISAPFILIIFGSLDFFKVIVSNNPEEMKKSRTNFFKRLAAFLLLYITPFFVKFLFSLTPYDMDGTNYVCAQKIDFSSNRSNSGISGTYNGYNVGTYGYGVGSGERQAIATAAAEIKDYIKENGYFYGYTNDNANILATPNQSSKVFCCATLVRAALYRAGIYNVDELNSILHNDEYAAHTATYLYNAGWQVIWNPDDLQPGDVLFYNKTVDDCTTAKIEGKTYYVCHTDIYYGDGKKVNTGDGCRKTNDDCPSYGGFKDKATITNFKSAPGTASSQGFLCGMRYPGK